MISLSSSVTADLQRLKIWTDTHTQSSLHYPFPVLQDLKVRRHPSPWLCVWCPELKRRARVGVASVRDRETGRLRSRQPVMIGLLSRYSLGSHCLGASGLLDFSCGICVSAHPCPTHTWGLPWWTLRVNTPCSLCPRVLYTSVFSCLTNT